jgi:hypothetical protein
MATYMRRGDTLPIGRIDPPDRYVFQWSCQFHQLCSCYDGSGIEPQQALGVVFYPELAKQVYHTLHDKPTEKRAKAVCIPSAVPSILGYAGT